MKGAIDPPVIVEQHFEVPVDALWRAITERDQMVQWFFDNIVAFEARVGFTTQFTIENEGRIFVHRWRIIEVEPLRKIVYNWQYEGYQGDSMVSFELKEQAGGCRVTVTHTVVESFPQSIPEFTRESCLGGWSYFIQQQLASYLAGE